MSTATAEKPNKVNISDAGPCRKKISIEIPKETVLASLDTTMASVASSASLPGFRPGRVPPRLLEKKFGDAVKNQARDQLLSAAVSKAVQDHKIRVVGEPTLAQGQTLTIESGKSLSVEVEVEVRPEITLPAFDALGVKKPTMSVADEMVKGEYTKLAVQEGTLEERSTAEPNDYLTGHAKLTGKDGTVYFESDGIVVQVPGTDKGGKGMIVGLMVEDLGKQLGLPKPGDKVSVKTKGPDNHENEKIRGIDLVIAYAPSRVDRIIPAKDEDLVNRFGLADKGALEQIIRQRLEQRVQVEQAALMRQQIARQLAEGVKLELPERLTAQQAERNLQRRRLELMYRGVDAQQIEEHVAELRAASGVDAVNELKLFFILDEAAEKLGVKVSEQEINGRIAQMAMERGERPEKLRQQLMQANQIGGIYLQIREHKTLDAILAKAKVTEVSAEDFNKEMAEKAASKADEKKAAKKK